MKQFDLFGKKEEPEEAEVIEETKRLQSMMRLVSSKGKGIYKHLRDNPADVALVLFIALGMDISNTLDDIAEVE